MKSEMLAIIANSPLLLLPLGALFLFIGIFVSMVVMTMRRKDNPAEALPLEEEGVGR